MKLTTEKWAHGSAQHNAWLAYVDAALLHTNGATFTDFEELTREAEDYVKNELDWRFLDE